jgi:hypothetical protein
MKIIKVMKCYECPYHEAEWNRQNQNFDMECKIFHFHIVSGDIKILYEQPIPEKCELAKSE